MRLLQLNPNGNDALALDFHPMITVVQGLSSSGRARVISAITALPQGTDPGCRGLVEAHGVLLDLSADTLALLDFSGDLEVLVQPSDLPGHQGVGTAGTGSLPSGLAPLGVNDFLDATPDGRYPELDAARRGQAQAREALEIMRGAVTRAQQGHEEMKVKRRRAEMALDAAREAQPRASLRLVTDEFEPDAVSGDELDLDVALGFDGQGEGAGRLPSGEGPPLSLQERRDTMEARRDVLEATIARIDRGINELAGVDARPVQVLLDAIRNPPPVELVSSQRGQELADDFVRLQREVQSLEESLETRGLGSQSAMARLDAARQEVAVAEKAMRPPEFTDLDRTELEAAHDEVLEITQGRGRSAKKRLEEMMAKEQVILDRMGFPTWSSYVMGAGLMGIDPAAEQRLETARFELESAEAHWSDVAAMIEADPVHRQLLDQLEAVYLEAFDMLRGDVEQQDLELKLRALQEPKDQVSIDDLVEALAYQLELVGIALPPEMVTFDRTVMIAGAFLEEAGAIIDRLNELGAEKVEALTELQALEEDLERLPVPDPMLDIADGDEGGLSDVGDGLGSAPVDDDPAEPEAPTVEDIEALEHDVGAALDEETDHRELVEAREALMDASIRIESVATLKLNKLAAELASHHASDAPDDAGVTIKSQSSADTEHAFEDVAEVNADAEAIEFYLLSRLSALRSVSYAGSVPVVIDDALAGLPTKGVERVLHKLERMSESVQIVYLSDNDTVSSWARSIGFERAAVVPAPASFA